MTDGGKTDKIRGMVDVLLKSFFIQVALGWACAYAGLLYVMATEFIPDQTYVTASGAARHIFLQPQMMLSLLIAYLLCLPVIYLVGVILRWFTGGGKKA